MSRNKIERQIWEGPRYNKISLFIGIIFGVVGILFSLYSGDKRSITYYSDNKATLIFSKNLISDNIKIVINDTQILDNNMFLIRFTLINDGDVPISRGDVKQDLVIYLDSSKKIYQCNVVENSGNKTFKPVIIDNNNIGLNFNYFDMGEIFTVQILYTGSENINFRLLGKVLGIKKISEKLNTPQRPLLDLITFILLGIGTILMFVSEVLFPKNRALILLTTFVACLFLIGLTSVTVIALLKYFGIVVN